MLAFATDLHDEGLDAVLGNVQERAGVDGLTLAVAYHDARDLFPHNPLHKVLDYLRSHPDALSLPEDPDAQGNGAVMRAAAHGAKAGSVEEAAENAWTEAALTHPSWEARASSALVAALVANLIDGIRPKEALDASYALVEGKDEPGKRVRETLRPLEGYEHNPGGWTVYTTRLALLGLLDAKSFRPGLEGVIRLGGDADTNGAVAGRS